MFTTEHSHTVAMAVLTAVRKRFGIELSEVHTGGGCWALDGRLESGHWIVVCDPDCFKLTDRIRREDESGDGFGWSVGIYPNSHDSDGDSWFGELSITDAYAYDVPATDTGALCDAIGRALRDLSALR